MRIADPEMLLQLVAATSGNSAGIAASRLDRTYLA